MRTYYAYIQEKYLKLIYLKKNLNKRPNSIRFLFYKILY